MLSYTYNYGEKTMSNLLLEVGLLGGIWNVISGTIGKIGAFLSTHFVPVADSIWTSAATFVKGIPAFVVAHPGAVVLGAVGIFAGLKLFRGITCGIKSLGARMKAAAARRQAECQMQQMEVAHVVAPAPAKTAEKAPAPAKAKSSKDKNTVVSPAQQYMIDLSTQDRLSGYRDFLNTRGSTPQPDFTPAHTGVRSLDEGMCR